MNCWEMFSCKVKENCPAYPEHGQHCARVAGTLCRGERQIMMARKIEGCNACEFYKSEHYDQTFQEIVPLDRAMAKLRVAEEDVRQRLARVEADIDKLLDLYQNDLITREKFSERVEPLNLLKQVLVENLETIQVAEVGE